jgi:hypothetical protein
LERIIERLNKEKEAALAESLQRISIPDIEVFLEGSEAKKGCKS